MMLRGASLVLLFLLSLVADTTVCRAQVWHALGAESFRAARYADGHFWLVAQEGALLRSADGVHWESVRHLLNDADLLFFGHGRALACGPRQEMERSTDGGNTWRLVTTNSTYALESLASAGEASDTVVSCGTFGTIVRSTDGGQSWSSIASGDDSLLFDVVFANKHVGYCSALDGVILKTEDAGFSWKKLAVPGAHQLRSVTTIGDSIVLAGDNYGRIFKSINAGATWDSVLPKPSIQISKMYYAYGKCYALGSDPTNRLWYSSPDTGRTWHYTQDTTVAVLWLFGVAMRDSMEGIRAGFPGLIERTTDGGTTWTTTAHSLMHNEPFLFERFQAVQFVDSLTGMVFGNDNRMLRTTDGGITWVTHVLEPRRFIQPDLTDVYFISHDTGIVVGAFGGYYRTTDIGLTWNGASGFSQADIYSIVSGSQRRLYMSGDSLLWLSMDNGSSWRDTVFHGASLGSLYFPQGDTGYLQFSEGLWPKNISLLARTMDGGVTWVVIDTSPPGITYVQNGARRVCLIEWRKDLAHDRWMPSLGHYSNWIPRLFPRSPHDFR